MLSNHSGRESRGYSKEKGSEGERTAGLSKGQSEDGQSFEKKVRSTAAVVKATVALPRRGCFCYIADAGVYVPKPKQENGYCLRATERKSKSRNIP